MKIANTPAATLINTLNSHSDSAKIESKQGIEDAVKAVAAQHNTKSDDSLSNNQNIREINDIVVTVYEPQRFQKVSQTLYFGELPSLFRQMQSHYQDFNTQLNNTDPQLTNKNWGFSIDEKGSFVVNGDITEDEKSYLEHKLNSNLELLGLAQQIPDVLIKGLSYDRGTDGKAEAWGKYDVNIDNFQDIIDIKEVLDVTYTERNDSGIFAEYFDMFKFPENIASQLRRNAQVKFNY
ncbi:hypothetical protein [Thalassotalea marina]|uniref:Uncharacterized protein n=1 Tax=Thalassotalea marina TaxID=1673741 RepID=A0A919BL33_9GAMM|nr:hypothetical protein [Thalassotalea marina]GHF94565.1 hypothetical protein GCM10017161_23520 [Thalassotalea marina]